MIPVDGCDGPGSYVKEGIETPTAEGIPQEPAPSCTVPFVSPCRQKCVEWIAVAFGHLEEDE